MKFSTKTRNDALRRGRGKRRHVRLGRAAFENPVLGCSHLRQDLGGVGEVVEIGEVLLLRGPEGGDLLPMLALSRCPSRFSFPVFLLLYLCFSIVYQRTARRTNSTQQYD